MTMKNNYSRVKRLILPLLITFHFSLLSSHAQNTAHVIGFGPSRILDTYISQEKYSGVGLTYLYIHEGKKPMLEGNYNLYWGRYRQWLLCDNRLKLQAGGLANVNLGFLYDMSTSNNPAQARFALNLMPSGIATYGFNIKQQHFSLRYELNLPLVGLMFSPNYGQSYYEIFSRGNYDHNIVPTTFISAPNFRQMLTLDWQATAKWAIRIGYLGNYQQAAVNNLKNHIYTHRFVIGITKTIGEK